MPPHHWSSRRRTGVTVEASDTQSDSLLAGGWTVKSTFYDLILCLLYFMRRQLMMRVLLCQRTRLQRGRRGCSAVAEQRDEGEEEQPAEDGGEGAIKEGGGGVMEKGGDERIDHHMRPQFAHPFYLLAWVRRSPRCGVMGKHLGPPCGS